MKINIITHRNGSGLEKDAAILIYLFTSAGWVAQFHEYHDPLAPPPADVNIFLELYRAEWATAPRNYLIPNQEWFEERWISCLHRLTAVLAKSRYAEKMFSQWAETKYIGFTSEDIEDSGILTRNRQFIHIRGRSTTKGTVQAIQAWIENPTLPPLHIYTHRSWTPEENKLLETQPDNIILHTSRIPRPAFRRLLNESLFHVCPSPCEGFGHYINEAKSCGNIVITTDAPPMNELIHDNITGFTVPVEKTEPFNLDVKYIPGPSGIALAARTCLALDSDMIHGISRACRVSYLKGKQEFEQRILKIIANE